MLWPQSQDYNEAIQNPKTCFKDADLKLGQAATNPLGMPLPCSGNFADVYQVQGAGGKGKWAVKCFTRGEPASLRARYAHIDKHLQQAKLPFTIGFQFLDEGIRIRGQWHAVLKMQWVEGFTLNQFVRDNLDKPSLLDSLLKIWVRMASRLRDGGLAHADLQHGNVMLVPGSSATALGVKLIDYDGMWVPSLAGQQSGEVGHPAYQHPQRLSEGTYSQDVDRFPLLVVAASLRCLRVAGRSLWDQFDNGDNLLFREEDLKAPAGSQVFKELSTLQDPQAKLLVERLRQACGEPLEKAPYLDELIGDAGAAKKSSAATGGAIQPAAAVTGMQTSPANPIMGTAPESAFEGLGDSAPEPRLTERPIRHAPATAAPPWRKWAIIGGSAAAVLVAVIIAMSSGGGDDKSKPDQHVDNTKDRKPTDIKPTDIKPTDIKPTDIKPPTPQLTLGKLPGIRLIAGESQRVSVQVGGVNGAAGFSAKLDTPPGVTAEHVLTDPRTGTVEWKLTASPDAAAGQLRVVVIASAGESKVEGDILVTMERPAVVVKPPPMDPPTATASRNELRRFDHASSSRSGGLSFSADGKQGFGSGSNSQVVWDLDKGDVRQVAAPGSLGRALLLPPDGRRALSVMGGKSVRIWDTQAAKSTDLGTHDTNINGVAVTRDGKRAVTISGAPVIEDNKIVMKDGQPVFQDCTLKVWDLDNARMVKQVLNLPAPAWDVAISDDGKRALVSPTLSREQFVVLVDLDTGREIKRIQWAGQSMTLGPGAMTGDGKLAAIAAGDRTIRLYDLEAGRDLQRLGPLPERIAALAFSRDGRSLLSGGGITRMGVAEHCYARLWEIPSGREMLRLEGHSKVIRTVSLSPDGRRALTGDDNTARLWDVTGSATVQQPVPPPSKAELLRLDSLENMSGAVAFSPDGKSAYGIAIQKLVAWDLKTGRIGQQWSPREPLPLGVLLPDLQNVLYASGQQRNVRVWNAQSGDVLTLGSHVTYVKALAVSRDGKRAISTSGEPAKEDGKPVIKDGIMVWEDCTLKVWDVEARKELRQLSNLTGLVQSVAISADGKRAIGGVASSKTNEPVALWDLETGKQTSLPVDIQGRVGVNAIALSADGRLAAIALGDRTIRLWDIEGKRELHRLSPQPEWTRCLAFSPDGRQLLTGGGLAKNTQPLTFEHCRARLWDVATGRELTQLEGDTHPVNSVAISPEGGRAITVSDDRIVRLWALKPGATVENPPTMPDPPTPVVDKKKTPPDQAARDAALKAVRELFKAEYASTRPVDRAVLADLLINKAHEVRDDGVTRYVLLIEACDIFTQIGSAQQAVAVVELLAGEYTLEAVSLKLDALTPAAKGANSSIAQKAVMEVCLAILDEARATENLPALGRLAGLADQVASRCQDAPTRLRLLLCVKEARDTVADAEAAANAMAVLKLNPDDAAANLICGKYTCFRVGDWKRGLGLLAKSDDAKLKELANKDLASPTAPDDRLSLADAWAELIKVNSDLGRIALLKRARHWYEAAAAGELIAPKKDRAEKQLKLIQDELPTIRKFRAASELSRLDGQTQSISGVAFLPDGSHALSASPDGTIWLWDLNTGQAAKKFTYGVGEMSNLVVLDKSHFVSTRSGGIYFWDTAEAAPRGRGIPGLVAGMAPIGNTGRVFAVSNEGSVWTVQDTSTQVLDGNKLAGRLTSAACSANGNVALVGAENGALLLYAPDQTKRKPIALGNHAPSVRAIALSPDGGRAVSAGSDGRVRVWDTNTKVELRRLSGHSGAVTSVAFSLDGRHVATASEDATVRIWNVGTGEEVRRFVGHKGKVTSVGFSPDGKRVVSGGEDKTVRVWGL